MSDSVDARGVEDLPAWVRRTWLVPFVIGLLLTIFGVVMLVNVNAGVNTLRWLVVFALVFGAIEAFATASMRRRPWVGWLVGAIYVLGAIIGIVWPGVTLQVLALTVGISLLLAGAAQAGFAWRAKNEARGWGWAFALGLIAVLAGLVFLFGNPIISVVVLAIVLACYMIFSGVTLLVLSFAVRRLTSTISTALNS
jgi:uncharacterized membrane protein HdeD (DUF308 family)